MIVINWYKNIIIFFANKIILTNEKMVKAYDEDYDNVLLMSMIMMMTRASVTWALWAIAMT